MSATLQGIVLIIHKLNINVLLTDTEKILITYLLILEKEKIEKSLLNDNKISEKYNEKKL